MYVKGELVGGLDILKEMVASGEFQAMLPPEDDLNTRLKKLLSTFAETDEIIRFVMHYFQ